MSPTTNMLGIGPQTNDKSVEDGTDNVEFFEWQVMALDKLLRDAADGKHDGRACDDLASDYAACIEEGDGDLVRLAVTRRAHRAGRALPLAPFLTPHRIKLWHDAVARHADVPEAAIHDVAARMRAAADRNWAAVHIATLIVEDDHIREVAEQLSSAAARTTAPTLAIAVNDRLYSYDIDITASGPLNEPTVDLIDDVCRQLIGIAAFSIGQTFYVRRGTSCDKPVPFRQALRFGAQYHAGNLDEHWKVWF